MLANGPVTFERDGPFPWALVRVYERDLVSDPRFDQHYIQIGLSLKEGGMVQMFARREFLDTR